VLSEHGFPGFLLYAGLIVSCILTLRRLRKGGPDGKPPSWIINYSHMLEVSIVGYCVAGSFLTIAYMETLFTVVALVIMLSVLANREASTSTESVPAEPGVAVTPSTRGYDVRHRRLR